MAIKVGDKLPNVTLTQATAEGPKPDRAESIRRATAWALS